MSRLARSTLASISFLFLAGATFAQSQLEWLTAHDEVLAASESGRACAVDVSGAVYVAGSVYPTTSAPDFELVKFSPAGTVLWSALKDAYGGYDLVLDCQVSPAGDVYVCGRGFVGASSDVDAVLLKYSSVGVLQWMKGSTSPAGLDDLYGIAFDAAGNVLVCGTSSTSSTSNGRDALVESYTPAGVLNWSTAIDGGFGLEDYAQSLTVLTSGEIAVAGGSYGPGSASDLAVWKLSATGAVLWTALLDSSNQTDRAEYIVEGSAGKLVVGGEGVVTAFGDWIVAQLDSGTGAFDWTAYYDGAASSYDDLRSIAIDAQGNTWACGTSTELLTGRDIAVRRYSPSGALLSSSIWSNGSGYVDDQPFQMLLGSAGQAWVCGKTSPPTTGIDALILQYDSSGALDWTQTYSTAGAFADIPTDMALASGNRIAMGGYTDGISGTSGSYDLMALQIDLNDSPQAYCTAKTTSTGCVPAVTFIGSPSASASSGFVVSCTQLRNQKNGLLFYGVNGAQATAFQGGTMCVALPRVRTALQNSGGNALPADDCSGTYSLDMNAYAAGALGGAPSPALLVAGTAVYCQLWGRDPGFAAPQNTMLSNALRYVVLP